MPHSPKPSLTIQTQGTMPHPIPLSPRLDVPIPSTPPAKHHSGSRSRSPSPSRTPGAKGTPRATSPSYRGFASPRPDHGSPNPGSGAGPSSYEPASTFDRFTRAVGQRTLRTVRRGNLPFLLVFVSCLILFFSSLAGIGYVAPDEIARTVEFLPGKPVFDLAGRQAMEKRMEEQKALESQWARMKRPKDGAWMQRARGDGAVRRKPSDPSSSASATAASEPTGPAPIDLRERAVRVAAEVANEEEDAES